jgi:hypothetical protein
MDAINSCNVLIQNARKKYGFRVQKVELGLLLLQTNKAQKVYLTRFGDLAFIWTTFSHNFYRTRPC